ncbi:twin-arginine translocation signal domain-containing protein [Natronolimnobius sp. AArcel1]|uniref:twin-arginine translocation signal domain-containing protein n=1 Tax=Natronolimnobius sp. AArcel1 TaxID=1679093 RepID=UPI0013EC06BA|nr:twin-arginine translocation signal domain-containing protein [Natronolimnobius sp. AArcel1]NGM70963.1 twin-arginine translocation signal domain-containing protein [Natronolimnobius sp. AArcel1]
MTEHDTTRRTFMKAAGAAGAVTIVAGCLGDDDDGNGNGNGNGNGDDDGDEAEAIEPGTEIELDGQTPGWVGIAPDSIDGDENPTLVLEEGETYEIGWTEGDGADHNIEIRDDGGDVVDDLQTDEVSDPDDDQWLEFEASSDMAEYVCDPHETTMVGEIVVE